MSVGRTIKLIRIARGRNLTELADSVKTSISYLSQIEKGHRTPSVRLLNEIANELRVPTSILFWEPSPKNEKDDDSSKNDALLEVLFKILQEVELAHDSRTEKAATNPKH